MIGRLRGLIAAKKPPECLLDVNGVFYEIQAPMTTFYHLPEIGKQTCLYTHFVVREDAQLLYGFYTERERDLFRALIKVNGVGPKLALTILSGMDVDSLLSCVQSGDSQRLTGIPGIGRKTAERLIIETKDALSKWQAQTGSSPSAASSNAINSATDDAMAALIALGYKPNDAKRSLDKIDSKDKSSEELIRMALQQMLNGVSA